MEPKAEYLFELSWEVCNKVGGIHTVITSKVKRMLQFYKEGYFAVGPFFPGKNIKEVFRESQPPSMFKEICEKIHNSGITCHFGNWLIEGEPNTILIDYSAFTNKLNEIKGELWEKFNIDSLGTQFHDYDEPMLWSYCAGIVLEQIKSALPDKKIVAQCHEWLAGGALLYLKSRNVKIGTVFTTHATMLGRTLSTNNVDLYGLLDKLNPQEEAYKFGIPAKFLTEKACTQSTDVFTTVSEITGLEATHFLGKKPDILLPNGLDTSIFPTFDEASVKHKLLKGKIKKFAMFYFFPYYQFDLDEALIFFLAGRNEFKNKGIDVYIRALGKLNELMKKEETDKTILAFIWVPAGVKEIKSCIMENRTNFEDIQDSIQDVSEEIRDRLIYGIVGKKEINKEFLLGNSLVKLTEKRLFRLIREGNAPVCTHELHDEGNDQVIRALRENNLNNSNTDNVKVIYYPIYLTGADRLTDLTYYEAIMASHLGVFPSYYEPWGYTPMETGGMGVASVTTDLAGFGRYIQKQDKGKKNPGIYVVERLNKSQDEAVAKLTEIFRKFTTLTKQDRIENKLKAKRLADIADWSHLVENYIEAHNMAADRVK
ncbi:glycogen/starch synthase [Candidatus Woesearchaeota archaeon]|nr:glycogen/starch synthase [Candidatus Woesearchaeota archaeon]